MTRIAGAAFAAALFAAGPAAAVDGVSVEYGKSDSTNSDVQLYRVGVQWDWNKRWLDGGNWHFGGFWDVSLGYWDNSSIGKTNSSLTEIGLTPTFRFQQNNPGEYAPYLEGAVGFHFLSHTSVSTQRMFGSSFQFGDHVGFGVRFGPKGAYDIGYRYQHLSNAGIKEPNQGINYNQIRFQYHF